jgi:chromosome segregation ATPase
MQEEISNLRVDNERLTQQLSSLQSGPARAGVSTALETQKRLTDREAEMEALRKELASARKANDDLAAQAKKLLDDQETLKRQLADRSGASQRLAAAENQRDEARKELEALKAREEELERDLRDQLAKAQAENESLTAAGQRLEDREHTGAGLTGQLAEAQSTIEQLKRENAGLKVQRAEPANQPAAAPAGTSDADELARLKDDLKRANSKVEMTVRSFTLLQEENERLKAQLAQTKTP